MSLGILAGLIILIGIALLVARPLLVAGQARRSLALSEQEQRLETLLFERESALAAIRDVQLDHAMGKLSDEDFAILDASSRARAVEVLQALDELGVVSESPTDEAALDAWIEQAVARVRGGAAHAATP